MNRQDQSVCALCHRQAELLNSHIISEFLYLPIYDEKHRFQQLSTVSGAKPGYPQKGIREPLLCQDCEGRFGRWETYVAPIFNGGASLEYKPFSGGVVVSRIIYHAFKLFGLSLLWRAGVSGLPEFSNIQLGPHAEKIRQMLLAANPGKFWEYGFHLNHPPDDAKEVFGKTLIIAGSVRYQAHHVQRFFIGATTWSFFVSNHMRAIDPRLFALTEDGSLTIRNGGTHMMNFFVQFASEISAAERNRTGAAEHRLERTSASEEIQ